MAPLMLNELPFGLPERRDQLFSSRHMCETAGERERERQSALFSLVSAASGEWITELGLRGWRVVGD